MSAGEYCNREVVVVEGTQKAISGRTIRLIDRVPLPGHRTAAAP